VQALNLGTTSPLSCLATQSDDDEKTQDNDFDRNVQVQSFTDGHKLALLCGSSVAHQAKELQRNAKVTIDSTKHVGREGLDELEE